jgi:hypothetical protein
MTNRTLFLLLALACAAACVLLVTFGFSGAGRGDRGGARLLAALILLAGVGAIYFFITAFSKTRHRFGYKHDEYTTFSCPTCKAELNYSLFPAFQDETACPKCGQRLTREGRKASTGFQFRFVRSPEVTYELSAQDGSALSSGPVTAEAIRAALAAGTGFTVADDPAGWLVLTATVGTPRWVDGPTPGSVIAEKQVARLLLLPTGDVSVVRPESVSLISTEINLATNVCEALSSALGSFRVRIRGADEWITVDGTGSSLGAQLVMQHLRMGGLIRPGE